MFTDNGSGGFVPDLTFFGGNIGWRAGSQQFTAHNLAFTDCATVVSMIWIGAGLGRISLSPVASLLSTQLHMGVMEVKVLAH